MTEFISVIILPFLIAFCIAEGIATLIIRRNNIMSPHSTNIHAGILVVFLAVFLSVCIAILVIKSL